jgi:serine/threonine protein kinase
MAFSTIISVILAVLVGAFLLAAGIFLIGKIFGITFLVLRNIFRFIGHEITDVLRFVSSVLASVLFAPLVVLSIVIGRWSASKHYAGALMDELRGAGRCVYRVCISNPARLFGLGYALEGVEQRVPGAMAAAPTRDKPNKKRVGMFDGYKIVGSLKGGGSGGKLYIAEPDEVKQAVFAKRKLGEVDQVVIKVFSLNDGSSLPQIVRESRALDAARQLGLVLEHEMTPDRFYYVMRYVPGESLSVVTQRMHTMSSSDGLGNEELAQAMGYARDLLVALDTYHNAELWHKDVKPDNIIVDGRDRDATAHLVDFGLITPMRSAMTLTTHGTEYFRDPELVRQALRGVKVHPIDGSKFDVYAAGAVLFSMIENSFPAHGGLSQLTKRCPEALRWITRRAMAEYDRRYPSAAAMLADLHVVMQASDPFKLRPVDLPSVSQGDQAAEDMVDSIPVPHPDDSVEPYFARQAGSPVPPRVAPPQRAPGARVGRPKTSIIDFWSGRYSVAGAVVATPKGKKQRSKRRGTPAGEAAFMHVSAERAGHRPLRDVSDRAPAREQVRSARARAQQRRDAASQRIGNARAHRRGRKGDYSNTPGAAVVFAGLLGFVVLFVGVGLLGALFMGSTRNAQNQATVVMSVPAVDASVAPGTNAASASTPQTPDAPDASGSTVFASSDGTVVINHTTTEHHTAALATVEAKLLLVPMLPQPIEPDLLFDLESGVHSMTHQGVEFVGSILPGEGDEIAIDMTAALRNAIGSTPMDTPDYPLHVQEWLATQPLDGVLLMYNQPSEPDNRRALLVTDRFHTNVPLNERTVETMLNVLSGNGYTGDE